MFQIAIESFLFRLLFFFLFNSFLSRRERKKISEWECLRCKNKRGAKTTSNKRTANLFRDSLVAEIFLIIIWCATIARSTPTPSLTPTERSRYRDKQKFWVTMSFCTKVFQLCFFETILHFQKSKLLFSSQDIERFDSVFLSLLRLGRKETHVMTILGPRVRRPLFLGSAAGAARRKRRQPRFVQPAASKVSLHQHRCPRRFQSHHCHYHPEMKTRHSARGHNRGTKSFTNSFKLHKPLSQSSLLVLCFSSALRYLAADEALSASQTSRRHSFLVR